VLAGVAVLAVGPIALAQQPASPQPRDQQPPGQRDKISLDVKDAPLPEVIDFIRRETGKNILLGKNPEGKDLRTLWPPLAVTVQFEEVPWEQALKLVADSVRCLVERQGEVWTVYQPPEVTIEMERAELREDQCN
jgi:type II secretory pathway component HofQ